MTYISQPYLSSGEQEAGLKPENQWKRVVIGQKGSDKPLSRSIVAGIWSMHLLFPWYLVDASLVSLVSGRCISCFLGNWSMHFYFP